MKKINLGNGRFTIVDADVYSWANKLLWHSRGGYAGRNGKYKNGKRLGPIWLHRLIVSCPSHLQVDHINGNTLDNRRVNLRICTREDNMKNYKPPHTNRSGYIGVCRCSGSKKWRAYIKVEGKQLHLGEFKNKIDAAKAYNNAALKFRGEYARLNRTTR